ncbi:hypothetical protein pb186bvf_021046 [Paramecium bursaria]
MMFHQNEDLIRLLEELQVYTHLEGQFNPDEETFFNIFAKLADELIIDQKPYSMGEFDQVSIVYFKCQQIFKCMGVNDFCFQDLFGEEKGRSKKLIYQLCQSLQLWRGQDMQIWRNRFEDIRTLDDDVQELREVLFRTKESYQNIVQEMSHIKEAVMRHENNKTQLQSKITELRQQLESAQDSLDTAQSNRYHSFDKRTQLQQIIISLERDINNLNKKLITNPNTLVNESNILQDKIKQLKQKEEQLIKQVKLQSLWNKIYSMYEQQLDELLQSVENQEQVSQMVNTTKLQLNNLNENIHKLQDDIATMNSTIKDLKLQQKMAEEENQQKEQIYTQELGVKRDDVTYLEQYALEQQELAEEMQRVLIQENSQMDEMHQIYLSMKRAIKRQMECLKEFRKEKTTNLEIHISNTINQVNQLTSQLEYLRIQEIEDQETL